MTVSFLLKKNKNVLPQAFGGDYVETGGQSIIAFVCINQDFFCNWSSICMVFLSPVSQM